MSLIIRELSMSYTQPLVLLILLSINQTGLTQGSPASLGHIDSDKSIWRSLPAEDRKAISEQIDAHRNIISSTTYIKASNTNNDDRFGFAVAISGHTMAVGAPREDSNASGINNDQGNNGAIEAGAVYVFVQHSGEWTQQAYIKASNTNLDDQFGWSVDLAGDTLVVGSPFEASNATGVNGSETNNSAFAAGAAYVFTRSGTTWSQQAYLKASNTGSGDLFGSAVNISGQTIVVAAPGEASNTTGVNGTQSNNSAPSAGAVYVFTNSGSDWSQQAYLKASNTNADDLFGSSLALAKDTLVVGAEGEASNATGINGDENNNSLATAGAAYVFVRNADTWSQQAYLKASNTGGGDEFGGAVDISGNTLVVGALGQDQDFNGNVATFAGAAYVFNRIGTVWNQQAYLKGFNTAASDQFGVAVAISGNQVLIGANGEDSQATGINGDGSDNTFNNSGAAYLYVRTAGNWEQQDYIKASNTGFFDDFGSDLDIFGGRLSIGAQREASNDVGIGGGGSNNSAANSGAVYTLVNDLIFKDEF